MRNTILLRDNFGNIIPIDSQLAHCYNCKNFMFEVLNIKHNVLTHPVLYYGRPVQKEKLLREHLKHLKHYGKLYFRHIDYHPAIAFFLEEYRNHEIFQYPDAGLKEISVPGKKMAFIFDEFMMAMREKASKINLKQKIVNWESKFIKNINRACEIESALFDKYANLTIIRLGLDYIASSFSLDEIDLAEREVQSIKTSSASWYENGGELSKTVPMTGRVGFSELQTDRKRLFANIKGKPSLFANLVGFIWHIDSNPCAGYHLSVLFFFDSRHVERHELLAEQIGKYWVNSITTGRGRFQQFKPGLNADLASFGLGTVSRDDLSKRNTLRQKVFTHFGLTHPLGQVIPQASCHLFGAGFLHRRRASGAGRKQTQGGRTSNQPGLGFE